MKKALLVTFLYFFVTHESFAASWERLYSMKSTDCFRHVQEASNGDFILTGYTADFNSNDTNGLVIRMDEDGDTIWTFRYDGPNHKEDCFYKGYQTSDGGFIICGYSRSFSSSDNAIYLKLNSSGVLQWVKNWGGSGIDRAQDIVELPNGDFVLVGYSTSSPAHYYDAFILKINDNGSTIWSKLYGWNSYDDANSIKLLPDGGFIVGGQSNSNLFLIRTDDQGDSLWTKSFGTTGTDNIESVAISHGGGFIMCGHTNGIGGSGNNGYIVETDTAGNVIWSDTYGGNDQDDLHYIDLTDDGGYIATGTSGGGTWPDPNIWMVKIDNAGNLDWQKYYGGDEHDHGYSGIQTSDGGYIVVGHTHSFANDNYNEDAFVVRTNSSGSVSNKLNYTTVTALVSPLTGTCATSNAQIKVEITNYGEATVTGIPVTVEITGAITQTLNQTYSSSVDRDETKTLTFSTTVDMSAGGTYNFHCFTGNDHDVIPERNYLDETIVLTAAPASPTVTNQSHCGPGFVTLTASSPEQIKWYKVASGGSSFNTGTTFDTPYLVNDTTYYVQAGTTCFSSRVPVTATITAGIAAPVSIDGSRCGNGSVVLSANSTDTIRWFDSPVRINELYIGSTFITPSISTSTTYYAEAVSSNCTSVRIPVEAVVFAEPTVDLGVDTVLASSSNVVLDAGPGFANYLWSNSQISQQLTVTTGGQYCVTITDTNGCTASDCAFVQFSVGINSAGQEKLISLFVNDRILYLRNPENEKLLFELFNIEGKLIDKKEISEISTELSYDHLHSGFYIARFSNNGLSIQKPFILN